MKKWILWTIGIFLASAAIGQPTVNLMLVGQDSLPTIATDVWGYVDPVSEKEYALIGSSDQGIFIYDVSDPTTPTEVANLSTVAGFDLKTYQNYLYTVNGGDFGSGSIIDLSDPESPQLAGSFPSAHNIWISDSGLLVTECNGMQIYDLSNDPLNPTLLFDDLTSQCHDALIVNDTLYDFHGSDGTIIYSIADPENPEILGLIDDPRIIYHHGGAPTKDGNYLFICDELSGQATPALPDVTIWNISDPTDPQYVGEIESSTATVHNIYIIDDLAFISFYADGIKIYDVSNPTMPVLLYNYDTSPSENEGFAGAFGIYPFAPSGNIYVSDRQAGLFIFGAGSTTSALEPVTGFSSRVFPNPVNTELKVEMNLEAPAEVSIRISDMLGRNVLPPEAFDAQAGIFLKAIPMNNLSSGVYILYLEAGGRIITHKFIRQ